jgi:hypothetical protein
VGENHFEYVGAGTAFTLGGAAITFGPLSYGGSGSADFCGVATYQDFGLGYEWIASGEIVAAGEAATSSL